MRCCLVVNGEDGRKEEGAKVEYKWNKLVKEIKNNLGGSQSTPRPIIYSYLMQYLGIKLLCAAHKTQQVLE